MEWPRVAVVILNWNGWSDTIECLESLYHPPQQNCTVIVVDNGSSDDSVDKIKDYCAGNIRVAPRGHPEVTVRNVIDVEEYGCVEENIVRISRSSVSAPQGANHLVLIQMRKNLGFARGNNAAMRFALSNLAPDYILLLNNDTVVESRFLHELITVGETDKKIGVLCPKIYFYDYEGKSNVIWYAGGEISWWREWVFRHRGVLELDTGQYDQVIETEWCTGAAFLLRRELAEKLPLNPVYTFGTEDVEYCMRIHKEGYKTVYVPSARIWHKVGVSRKKVGKRIRRDIASYFHFLLENFSVPVFVYHVVQLLTLVLPRWFIVYAIERGDKAALSDFTKGMRAFVSTLIGGSHGD